MIYFGYMITGFDVTEVSGSCLGGSQVLPSLSHFSLTKFIDFINKTQHTIDIYFHIHMVDNNKFGGCGY